MPCHQVCTVRWPQGLKRKNLQITGSISKESLNYRVGILTFFFTGRKPELAQITGGKNILTQLINKDC